VRRYAVSPALSAPELLAGLAGAGLCLICWLGVFCAAMTEPSSLVKQYAEIAVFVSVTVLFLGIVRLIFARDMLRTVVDISDTAIQKSGAARIVRVEFSRVTTFAYRHAPGLFGFGVIAYPHGSIMLSFFIRDLPKLIADVRAGIDRCGGGAAYEPSNIDRFSRAAFLAEGRNERLRRFFPNLFSVLVMVLIVAMVTAIFLWHFPVVLAVLWAAVVLVLYLLSITVAEVVLSAQGPGRHPDETCTYFATGLVACVACLCLGILLSTAFV